VLFDGVCGLCNASVGFVLERERGPTLRFAPLQSDAARSLLVRCGIDPEGLDTLVLIEGDRAWVRSDAALRIARHLRAPWRWCHAFRVVPRFVRDTVYRCVARVRYRMFGRLDACVMPTPELASRFVDSEQDAPDR